MTPQDADTHEVAGFDDLKPFTSVNGPCVTAVIGLDHPTETQARWKNLLRWMNRELTDRTGPGTAADLMEPVLGLAIERARVWAHALLLLRAPSVFRYYLLHGRHPELRAVGSRFLIRPLLRNLAHETRFHVLAISRNHVRLIDCTQHRAVPAMAGEMPAGLELWKNNRQPDHTMENRASAGPSAGTGKGVVSGSNADSDRADEYLAHYFNEIDKAVTPYLRTRTGPLILAGVEQDLAVYRRVNTFRPTLMRSVHGGPDALSDRALHERAMEVVTGTIVEPLRNATTQIRDYAGTNRTSTRPADVVRAAFQGRVLDLLIEGSAEFRGGWNQQSSDIDTRGDEDLLNAAALETIRHGGRAFVVDEADMPVKAPAAAFLRF